MHSCYSVREAAQTARYMRRTTAVPASLHRRRTGSEGVGPKRAPHQKTCQAIETT